MHPFPHTHTHSGIPAIMGHKDISNKIKLPARTVLGGRKGSFIREVPSFQNCH